MTALFTLVVFAQFYLDGLEMKWVTVATVIIAVAAVCAFFFISHVHTRVMLFMHPTKTTAYQALTALSAFGNGGMFGLGPGEGEVKHFLPDARADFVFAVAGEEFGLFFCGFIILVFAAIVVRAMMRLLDEPNLFVVLAAGGLIIGFGLQAFVNMAFFAFADPDQGDDVALYLLRRQFGTGDFDADGIFAGVDPQAPSERSGMRGPRVQPIVIAAGGTGGHFFPAEALAAALIARGERVVLMADARSGGLSSPVFGNAERYVISGAGLAGRGAGRALQGGAALLRGIAQSRKILKDLQPGAVVAFGGYPAVPPVLAARSLISARSWRSERRQRPVILLHEQNAGAGPRQSFFGTRGGPVVVEFPEHFESA